MEKIIYSTIKFLYLFVFVLTKVINFPFSPFYFRHLELVVLIFYFQILYIFFHYQLI
jgi:hypothetical protein